MGNYIKGYGCFNETIGSAYGIQILGQKDAILSHNFLWGIKFGISVSRAVNISGGVLYNIIKNCEQGIRVLCEDLAVLNNFIISLN